MCRRCEWRRHRGALFLAGRDPRSLADLLEAARQTFRTGLPSFTLSPRRCFRAGLLTYLRNQLGADTLVEDLRVRSSSPRPTSPRRSLLHRSRPLADPCGVQRRAGHLPAGGRQRPASVDGGVSDRSCRPPGHRCRSVIAVNVMQVGKTRSGSTDPAPAPLPSVVENRSSGLDGRGPQIAAHACRTAMWSCDPEADPSWHDVVPAAAYMRRGERAMTAGCPRPGACCSARRASHSMVAEGGAAVDRRVPPRVGAATIRRSHVAEVFTERADRIPVTTVGARARVVGSAAAAQRSHLRSSSRPRSEQTRSNVRAPAESRPRAPRRR